MDKMQELYNKVANSNELQAEFAKIIEQYTDKPDELKERLLNFAQASGYAVDYEEVQGFFAKVAEQSESELSEQELDGVAGGKSDADNHHIYKSLATAGGYCLGYSIAHCSDYV
jgi:benzoyl-CoA reductase/2-hydroxyglutaryl-CoA dehydratase subunit BcrC/BadD/HgdB